MNMQKLTQKTAAREDVYETLRQQIIEFELLPGEFLSENGLAARLNVNRTTVREALARLEMDHCV